MIDFIFVYGLPGSDKKWPGRPLVSNDKLVFFLGDIFHKSIIEQMQSQMQSQIAWTIDIQICILEGILEVKIVFGNGRQFIIGNIGYGDYRYIR